VYTPHDILPFKYIGLSIPVFLTYKLSDALIVHNKKNKDDLINHFGLKEQKISIIPHGNYNYLLKGISQQEARKRLDLSENKKVVLLFGNIRSGKGIETTISALKYLKKRRDVLLLIAGKVSWEYDIEKLKNMISDNGLEDFVLIRDEFIEDSLVEAYYRSSDVVVIPYEQGYESGVLKYAFSCGLPVIASDLPEFSYFAEDSNNCLIFNRGKYRELAEKIEILLDNKEICQIISSNAKKLSDLKWNWNRSAAQTKRIYESLL
jgi:glycosyltransferase involved in cell wall biosynthesis